MRHEAKAEEKQFLSEWLREREMTDGTAWDTLWRSVISAGSYEYEHGITISIVL